MLSFLRHDHAKNTPPRGKRPTAQIKLFPHVKTPYDTIGVYFIRRERNQNTQDEDLVLDHRPRDSGGIVVVPRQCLRTDLPPEDRPFVDAPRREGRRRNRIVGIRPPRRSDDDWPGRRPVVPDVRSHGGE